MDESISFPVSVLNGFGVGHYMDWEAMCVMGEYGDERR